MTEQQDFYCIKKFRQYYCGSASLLQKLTLPSENEGSVYIVKYIQLFNFFSMPIVLTTHKDPF